MEKHISPETIKRLSVYLRYLEIISLRGVRTVSSSQVSAALNIPSTQFRKDLSFFGEFGRRGVGYDVDNLIATIRGIMGIEDITKAVIAGAGKLGSALLSYPGFANLNVSIVGAFDRDAEKIGTSINGVPVMDIGEAGCFIEKNRVGIGILTVPAEEALSVAKTLVNSGIKGLLNFAPVSIKLDREVFISNVDMASELGWLIFKLSLE